MKKFLNEEWLALGIFLSFILVFVVVFYLMNLSWYGYFLGVAIVSFLGLIFFGVKYANYQKKENIERAYEDLKEAYKQAKLQNSENYQSLEDYFILWIHQIKTPITAAKLLADDQKQGDMKGLLIEIENYSQLAMSFLKLNNPATDLNLKTVVVDEILKPLFRKYSSQFIASKTQLIYQPIMDKVITDANWTQIMVEQILNNALKYAAGKTIHIYFENNKLFIEDKGMGIRSEDLPKIFDKGYSGFNGQLNEKSSGLGLFIVDSIANRLNQPVQVSSSPKQGTCFTIEFPRQTDYQ